MTTLSKHQTSALVALLVGPKSSGELAAELELGFRATQGMMRALHDRGLVSPSGKRGAVRQSPRLFTYSLTTPGRLQAEAAQDNAAIAEPPEFVGSVDELEAKIGGDS